jgi:exonuclease VII large subunit
MSGIEQPAPAVTPTAALGLVEAAVRRACPHPVWLSGEVEQVAGPGPNVSMTVADQQAQIRVAVIGLDAHRVTGRLVRAGVVLERGAKVRVYGHLRLYAGEGLVELRASDIDTAVAVGAAELERRRVLEVIGRLGLAGRQQTMGTPVAPLRVGVVTPAGRAGPISKRDCR